MLLLRRGGCVERAEERTEDADRGTLESEGVSVEVEEKGLELLRGVRTAEEGGGRGASWLDCWKVSETLTVKEP